MDKNHQIIKLAQKRKATRWDGYGCIGDYNDGVYECEYVSPYTKSAHNIDSDIMVILQDWSSDSRLIGKLDQDAMKYGYTPSLPTNKNLIRLLNAYFGLGLNDIYATNLFPFIKYGALSATIPRNDLIRAAQEFALPQIKIVCPKLVVCIGGATFNAIRRACGYKDWMNIDSAIESPFMADKSQIWCQAHTGQLGQNNRNQGGVDRVSSDWEKMKHVIIS
jgi:uracil-DNA glycosylase